MILPSVREIDEMLLVSDEPTTNAEEAYDLQGMAQYDVIGKWIEFLR